MRPWNPFSLSRTGAPIVGQVPVRYVVHGRQPSPTQSAELQARFADFISVSRQSVVRNPSATGLLSDGSRYTIDCVSGACTCALWPVGEDGIQAISGILFDQADIVIVNKGKVGAPTSKWVIEDVSRIVRSDGYYPKGSWKTAPYNSAVSANTSVTLGGKERYVYQQSQSVARHGNLFAYMQGAWSVAGMASNRTALAIYKVEGERLKAGTSVKIDPKNVFQEYGATPLLSPKLIGIAYEAVLSESNADRSKAVDAYSAVLPRNGRRLVFTEYVSSGKLGPASITSGKFYSRSPAGGYAYVSSEGGLNFLQDVNRAFVRFSDTSIHVMESARTAGSFATPVIRHVVPQSYVNSGYMFPASFNYVDDGVDIDIRSTPCAVVEKSAPPAAIIAEWQTSGPDPWHMGSVAATGPISGAFTRAEKTHSVSPHFFGDALVLLELVLDLNYSESCSGSVSIRYLDGYFDKSSDHATHQPQGLTGASEMHEDISQDVNVSMSRDVYYELGGERLYLEKYRYTENAAISASSFLSLAGATPSRGHDYSMTYDVAREQRRLLVYDPELDLTCYTECVFSTTKSFSETYRAVGTDESAWTYSNSGGGTIPAAPEVRLIIKCRGKERVIQSVFDTRGKNIASVLPTTGISPYAVKDGPLLTSEGFPKWGLQKVAGGNKDQARLFFIDLNYGVHENVTGDGIFDVMRGEAPYMTLANVEIEYVKTPETGAAYMRLISKDEGLPWFDHSFLVDSAGVRPLADVLPLLAIGSEKGLPF